MKQLSVLLSITVGLGALSLTAGEISTSTTNGDTVVVWNGKEVYRGSTEGPVKSVASTVNGEELAAVIAEDGTVLWESDSGAAAKIGSMQPEIESLLEKAGKESGVEVSSANGESVVKYQGKEVWRGRPRDEVAARSKTENGKDYAAAFDGTRVIWENVPGAAKEVGSPPQKGKEKTP